MLSFWPSLSLLVFFLAIFLQCRAVGGRVTLPLGSFVTLFACGCVGATLLSLLLQQLPLFQFTAVRNSHLDLIMPGAWLTAPWIEEFAKALPVIVLAFFPGVSRRLSIADLTLAGFASGAGFGFVEGNLHALVDGTLPNFWSLAVLDFDGVQRVASAYTTNFAGHCVYPALFGLAAGIGLRLYPVRQDCAWIPAAVVFVLAIFDHAMFNWKIAHPGMASGGNFLDAPPAAEFLYWLTLHGRLETWLLLLGLIAAQGVEARLCAMATGKRRDLLLPQEFPEFGSWVITEWLVALSRLPLGRAAVGHTLSYFRRRRAFALATLEAKRNPNDRALTRHARFLEERLERERQFLIDPPLGAWLLPWPVLLQSLKSRAWRLRWVLTFDLLFVFLFMVGADQLPQSWRQFLFGTVFTAIIVVCGLGFAAWQGFLFFQRPRPDLVAAESAVYAGYHTRALLLAASLVSGIYPALSLLLGWKALLPGAVYLGGHLPGWIAQGGNPHTLMGLGALGGAAESDAGPAGEALRDEIAAARERIRSLEKQFAEKIASALSPSATGQMAVAPARTSRDGMLRTMADALRHDGGNGIPFGLGGGTFGGRQKPPDDRAPLDLTLDEFFDLMVRLDAERDTQERRKRALDECERQASETRGDDLDRLVRAVKAEFEALEAELRTAVAKELEQIAAFEQGYGKAWAKIVRDLDSYDISRRSLKTPMHDFWQPHRDMAWALSVATTTDETAQPLLRLLLPELEGFASQAKGEIAEILEPAVGRIRAAVNLETADEVGAAADFGILDDYANIETAASGEEEGSPAVEQSSQLFESAESFELDVPAPVDVSSTSSIVDLPDAIPAAQESDDVSAQSSDSAQTSVGTPEPQVADDLDSKSPMQALSDPVDETLEAPTLRDEEATRGSGTPAFDDELIFVDVADLTGDSMKMGPAPSHEDSQQDRGAADEESREEFDSLSEADSAELDSVTDIEEPQPPPEQSESAVDWPFLEMPGAPENRVDSGLPTNVYEADIQAKPYEAIETEAFAEEAAKAEEETRISLELSEPQEDARAEPESLTLVLDVENFVEETATEIYARSDDASSDASKPDIAETPAAVLPLPSNKTGLSRSSESQSPMQAEAAHSEPRSSSQLGIWRKVTNYLRGQLQKGADLPAAQRQPAESFSPVMPARDPEPTDLEFAIKPAATNDASDSMPAPDPAASIEEAHPQTTQISAEEEHKELDRLLDLIRRDSGYVGGSENSEAAISAVDEVRVQTATERGEQDHAEVDRLLDVIKRDSGYLGAVENSEAASSAVDEGRVQTATERGEQDHAEVDRLLDAIKRDSGYLGAPNNTEVAVSLVDDGSLQSTSARAEQDHEEVERLLDAIKRDSGYLGPTSDFESSNDLRERLQESIELPHPVSEPAGFAQEASLEAPTQQDSPEAPADDLEAPRLESESFTAFEGPGDTPTEPAQSFDAVLGAESDADAPEPSPEAPMQDGPEAFADGLEPLTLESEPATVSEESTPTEQAQSFDASLEAEADAKAPAEIPTTEELDWNAPARTVAIDSAESANDEDAAGSIADAAVEKIETEEIDGGLPQGEPAPGEPSSAALEPPRDAIHDALADVDSFKAVEVAVSQDAPSENEVDAQSLEATPEPEADVDAMWAAEAATTPEPQGENTTQSEIGFAEEVPAELASGISVTPSGAEEAPAPLLESQPYDASETPAPFHETVALPPPNPVEEAEAIGPDSPETRQAEDVEQEAPKLEIEAPAESQAAGSDARADTSTPDQAPEPRPPTMAAPNDAQAEARESQKPMQRSGRSRSGSGIWRKVGGLLRRNGDDDPSEATRDIGKLSFEVATKRIEPVQPPVPPESSTSSMPMDESESAPITLDGADVAKTTPYEPDQAPEQGSGAQLEDLPAVAVPSPPAEDVLDLRAPTPDVPVAPDSAPKTPVSVPAKDEELDANGDGAVDPGAMKNPTVTSAPTAQLQRPNGHTNGEKAEAPKTPNEAGLPPPPPTLEEFLRAQGQTSDDRPAVAAPWRQQARGVEPKAPARDLSAPNLEDYLRAQAKTSAERTPAAKPPRQARSGSPRAPTKPIVEQKAPTPELEPTKLEEHPPASTKPSVEQKEPTPELEPTKLEEGARADAQVPEEGPPLVAKRLRPARGTGKTSAKQVVEQEAPAPNPGLPTASGGMRPTKFFKPVPTSRAAVDEAPAPQKPAAEARARSAGSTLAKALSDHYGSLGEPQPPIHTTDRESLLKIIDSGKLETPRKGPAPWSFSGMLRKNDVAIRLKPGADKYVEFIPSTETFGQMTRFYPRTVGIGAYKTFIPAEHLEVFDAEAREWLPLQR